MKLTTAIKKFETAGATITTLQLTEKTTRYIATFENGKRIEFMPDFETGEIDTFARPYYYDEADQETKCFFYDTAKKAIERGLQA